MPPILKKLALPILCVVGMTAWVVSANKSDPSDHHESEHEHVELAPFMTQLQWHSQKLGYAIEGRNAPLAEFYLHEVTEVLEEIQKEVPVHDKLPIGELIGKIPQPLLKPLDHQIETGDWAGATKAYAALIDSCNRCHTATQHQFIVITPAHGHPPFNQLFSPVKSNRPEDSR